MRHLRPLRPSPFLHWPTILAGLLLLAVLGPNGLLEAQEPEAPQRASEPERSASRQSEPEITKIYKVRHADVEELSSLIRIFSLPLTPNRELGVIGLRGPESKVHAALEALENLDVPPKPTPSIELTLWILLGSKTPDGDELPEALQPVVRQLRGTLGYQAFELLDTVLVRTRHRGKVASGGTFQASGALSVPANYGLDVASAEVVPGSGDRATTVRLNNLRFVLYPELEEGQTGRPTSLETYVEMREGQKVVVGKATTSPDNSGMILVVEARVE